MTVCSLRSRVESNIETSEVLNPNCYKWWVLSTGLYEWSSMRDLRSFLEI